MQHHAVRDAVAVPRDDLRALAGIGRGELLGAGGELIAQLALDAPHGVARVLADFERELVGVLPMRVLCLRATLRERAVLLVAIRLTAEDDAGYDADRVDEREPDHLAEH